MVSWSNILSGKVFRSKSDRVYARDQLGIKAGINLYAYVNANPVNFTDPSGLLASQVGNYLTQGISYFNNQVGQFAVNTFGDPSTWPGNGSVAGGIAGGAIGWFGGGVGGGASGSFALPGGGTYAGAYAGSALGAAQGAAVGTAAGGILGTAAADLYYLSQNNNSSQSSSSGAQSEPGNWTSVNESMSPRAASYQSQVTGADPGSSYVVNGVKFDGYSNGTLLDAKGPGYSNFVNSSGNFQDWFTGQQSLVNQARNQIAAANGTPITWYVAEPSAANAISNLLSSRGFGAINVVNVLPK